MSPFMKVPLEIRNQIYGYLLSTKYTKVDFTDESPVSDNILTGYLLNFVPDNSHFLGVHCPLLMDVPTLSYLPFPPCNTRRKSPNKS